MSEDPCTCDAVGAGTEPVLASDVAGWQKPHNCDWLRADLLKERAVWVKMSQGERRMKSGQKHLAALKKAGTDIAVGGYHFADPLKKGLRTFRPEAQADTFCDALEAAGWPWRNALRPVLDIEWKSFGRSKKGKARGKAYRRQFKAKRVIEWVHRFCDRVRERLGVETMIYTGRSYSKYRLRNNATLSQYALWLAAYVDVGQNRDRVPDGVKAPPIVLKDGTKWRVVVHQYTGRGRAKWYRKGKGKIDRDILTAADLEALRVVSAAVVAA